MINITFQNNGNLLEFVVDYKNEKKVLSILEQKCK